MELLTKKEVAAQFKVTPQTIDRWAKRGILKKLNPGGNTRAVTQVIWLLWFRVNMPADPHKYSKA